MNIKLEKLKTELLTQDEEKFKQTLERLKDNGKLDEIPVIFNVFFNIENRTFKHLLFELMSSIVKKGADGTWIELLKNQSDPVAKRLILQIMWNSRLSFNPFLVYLVDLACKEDELTGLECLTLIENMEGVFQESPLMDAQVILVDYLNKEKMNLSVAKNKILQEILNWIIEQDNRIL